MYSQVIATHAYKSEDDDELSFDAQEIIYVVDYEDPDEQVRQQLMLVKLSCLPLCNRVICPFSLLL